MLNEFLHALNQEQLEAVTCNKGPLLVISGAGSGKTRVVTSKIAYLLHEKGESPDSILAVTFTNKAAREIKERVVSLVGTDANRLWVFTFHAACVRILRSHAERLGYQKNFLIYSSPDQLNLVRSITKELKASNKDLTDEAIRHRISLAKNSLLTPEEFEADAITPNQKTVAKVYHLYQKRLQQNNAADFDDLLVKTVHLLEEHKDIREYYQQRFRSILVDEYQDTNTAQYRLITSLYPPQGSPEFMPDHHLCAVGDEDQSIYQWRGADIQNILRFQEDFPEAKVVRMEQNYRSTKTILDAANQVISVNKRRFKKKLWTENEPGSTIVTFLGSDEMEESRYIAKRIASLRQEECFRYLDCAVFYRTHAQSRSIEESLREENVPYTVIGGTRFYDRKEVRDIIAYLKALINPADEMSIERIINVPRRGIGETTIKKIKARSAETSKPLYYIIQNIHDFTDISKRSREAIARFDKFLAGFKELVLKLPIGDLIDQLIIESGYLEELDKEDRITSETRKDNLGELISSAREYNQMNPEGDLVDFLEHLSLYDAIDTSDKSAGGDPREPQDTVALMTLHNAKGLEFKFVFMSGMEEGIFPHSRSFAHPEEMEEERRLCYVGMTRAEKRLYITSCVKRRLYGNETFNPVSRFLRDIDSDYLSESPSTISRVRRSKLLINAEKGKKEFQKSGRYQVGQNVVHPKWGQGKIRSIVGTGPEAKLMVNFQTSGLKKLISKFANLSNA